MTPKEKAKELVHKHLNYFGVNKDSVEEEKAVISAMITVDEILKLPMLSAGWQDGINLPSNNRQKPYWQEVKKEIENL